MKTITDIQPEVETGNIVNERPGGTSDSTATPAGLVTTLTVLKFTFGLVPIVAGLDKFTDLLVNWDNYLNPLVLKLIPLSAHAFMGVVGIIEILAGLLTLARPRLGGYIVMAWLIGISLSLIASGRYLDVAVRDLVMAVGAFALANLSSMVTKTNTGRSL